MRKPGWKREKEWGQGGRGRLAETPVAAIEGPPRAPGLYSPSRVRERGGGKGSGEAAEWPLWLLNGGNGTHRAAGSK